MTAQEDLLDKIRRSASPLLSPSPLAHSLELAEDLPLVRRHLGPRAWYQALEGTETASNHRPRNE